MDVRVVAVDIVVMVMMAAGLAPFFAHLFFGQPARHIGRLPIGFVKAATGD